MELKFTKMHGCGNDYIYINCFEQRLETPEVYVPRLSDRHYGIGGDGVVLIEPSHTADAKMRMFNIDGSEGKMCGNAIRCVAKYLYDNNIAKKQKMKIETLSGIKSLFLETKGGYVSSAKVNMGQAELCPEKIPVNLPGPPVINRPLVIGDKEYLVTCVSMGNPHAVVFCESVDNLNLHEVGVLFEKNPIFPEGVNTEFCELINKNTLKMRVWERGSGETLACGTGACACAVSAVLNGVCAMGEDIHVHLSGGNLIINYTDNAVYMTGGCEKVFDGTISLKQ